MTDELKLGLVLGYWFAQPPTGVAEQIAAAEELGFDSVWSAEAYGSDCFTPLAWYGAATSRMQLGTAVCQMAARTPVATAMSALTLDHLTGGRFVLGLGASGPQVIEGWHGVRYDKPLGRTREIVSICREVWAREGRLRHDGPIYHLPLPEGEGSGLGKPLKIIAHPVRPRIPIWIASLGPKNVETTAEVADGWMPIFFHPEKAKEVWGDDLARGHAKRAADLDPLMITAGGMVAIGDDVAGFREMARPMIALYVGGMGAKGHNFYNDLVQRYGFEQEAAEIQDLYLAGQKDEAAAKVPDALLEATSLCGPEGYVRERIAAFAEAGVTHLNVIPIPTGDQTQATVVSQVKEWCEAL